MKKLITILVALAIIIIVFFLLGPFFILEEGEQAVVIRFGAIQRTTGEAGLHLKMPITDNVVLYSERILSWDGDPQRVPTQENQFIWVDTTARWRITDPETYYARVTTMEQGYARLDDLIDSSVRTIIASNPLREAVRNSNIINEIEREDAYASDDIDMDELADLTFTEANYDRIQIGRRELSDQMHESIQEIVTQFGIEVIDVVIRQIRYSDDLTESVYSRMISERNRIAQAFRSFGEGRRRELLGRIENDRRTILSEAYQESEEIRGEADARASAIYADAYNQDPDFFEFWRAIESYRRTMPNFEKVLTTDMDYFRYLYSAEGQ
ncbi:MAG: protease modulator HflC [Spirochaetia bacterium]